MFQSIRKKVVKLGGYVTMIKNSNYLPYVEDVFTINRERFNISQSIKKSFDPKKILNPEETRFTTLPAAEKLIDDIRAEKNISNEKLDYMNEIDQYLKQMRQTYEKVL